MNYLENKSKLSSFDLILFSGGNYVSEFISFLERKHLDIPENIKSYCHVGIVIKNDVLNDDRLEDDKIYIWESILSGALSDGIKNIDGKEFFGTQLRELDQVVEVYKKRDDMEVVWCKLVQDIDHQLVRDKFTDIFKKYNNIKYDYNPVSLFSSIFSVFRCFRDHFERMIESEDWLFCSELVALVYKELGIFPRNIGIKNVIPMDFLGYDLDKVHNGGIPCVVNIPPVVLK